MVKHVRSMTKVGGVLWAKGKWLRIKITVLKNGGVQNMPRKSSSVPPWTFDDVYNSCGVLSDLHRMLSPCLYYVVYA